MQQNQMCNVTEMSTDNLKCRTIKLRFAHILLEVNDWAASNI